MLETLGMQKQGKLTNENLQIIAGGYSAFQLLWAGIKMGVFNFLSEKPGAGFEELRHYLNIQEKPTKILMNGLLSIGLIEKLKDGYRNSSPVEEQLVEGKPQSVAPLFEWHARINYPAMLDFVDSLRENRNVGLRHFSGEGKTLYERLSSNPDLEEVFQRAMSTLSSKTNPALIQSFDFSKFRHVLDVGGGDGTNAAALVKAFPHLKATVFDIPSVCERAKAKIKSLGLEGKIQTHPGNFLEDAFPSNVDVVLFNHIMPIWSAERNQKLVEASFKTLPKGGAIIIFNMMNDEDSWPITPALGSMYFLSLATGEGMLYSWKEYTDWLEKGGFREIKRVGDFCLDHGVIFGFK
jgi:ubiquinone/menaquinone biosynthesis C-methylase UbiE